ncbi:ABC transporter ATP-binding protein [Rothia sp. SD9660Na]|uniref:energy-coupling factor ABC transporter ATP-binding protein n=1 Tax=Rothia sp. SD9660Na TaxID=3047030 RepID=UPI0024B9A746|nr:ABC transporter ATP-binding protein [Rothia sp. SD9660Na]WHS49534.1 ABC transporter ATP-binding protein [Rothia sp. SD9660Na]
MFFSRSSRASAASPSARFSDDGLLATRSATATVDTGTSDRTLLHDITVELSAPRTAVLGLNGSGKSTFLRLFNGLSPLTSGEVSVHGVSVSENLAAVRSRVGMLFSDPGAQLVMPTGVEDVELSLQHIKGKDARRSAALAALAERGVEHRAFDSVYNLSGGEKQLTALAAVLAVDPKVLLLDEPTTLLDLKNRLRLFDLLDSIPQQQVISTHDLDLAATCDEAIIIHRGYLLAHGPACEVLKDYRRWCTTDFPAIPESADPERPDGSRA